MHTKVSTNIETLVDKFQTATIQELDELNLLNRRDTKFVFSADLLDDIIDALSDKYKILEIKEKKVFNYSNQYFDTDDFQLYHNHHNGKMNRYKIRYRTYLDTGTCFFEVKYKTNKKRTIKYRLRKKEAETSINGRSGILVRDMMNSDPSMFKPKTKVQYKRITLVHKTAPEKVTIDFDINFFNDKVSRNVYGMVIAEVKQDKYIKKSDFFDLMSENNIKKLKISKYCLGTLSTYQNVKYNRFKSKLIRINKLCYGNTAKFKLIS